MDQSTDECVRFDTDVPTRLLSEVIRTRVDVGYTVSIETAFPRTRPVPQARRRHIILTLDRFWQIQPARLAAVIFPDKRDCRRPARASPGSQNSTMQAGAAPAPAPAAGPLSAHALPFPSRKKCKRIVVNNNVPTTVCQGYYINI
ncbi:hypothetical protein EVAR_42757_1 [Eumeta japonica]|uniref:Uncharacterized protein n=1 Tax=Eumeta variegata TaxID=151549 RepID=A0A4C1WJE8_EUMVA|nr:hypothetical protein EVAR_42757_1 [Eumeta japonica]